MPGHFININTLNDIVWEEASAATYTKTDLITVWRIEIAALKLSLNNLQTLLQPPELAKINRYQQETDRNQRIISKAVLRILLSRYSGIAAQEIKFSADQNKKPCLENTFSKDLHFNVSHSGNWVLIVIAESSVGIDLERLNASFSYQNLLSFSFSAEEINFIEKSASPHKTFYQLWTRKESLLKATGKGLIDELAQIPALNGVHQNSFLITKSEIDWQISSFNVDENHVASISFNPVKTALQFFNFRF